MKKLLFLASAVLLLAAGCNNQKTATEINPSPTPTPTAIPTPSAQSKVYENQYMKVTIPQGWVAKEAVKTSYDANCGNKANCTITPKTEPNPGAVNITKGNYILYINTLASQASGVQGGRFAEIAMGAPSADAVVTEQPSECGTSDTEAIFLDHSRVDLYVGPKDKQPYCNVPTNGKTVWFFSYVTDKNHGYFNYYSPDGSGPTGYVITMAYNSKVVNNFPAKGSVELTTMLNEMTDIVKSLQIKQQ